MKIYILTDQEGVAGVVNATDYSKPGDRYYEVARELATLEVNAAIEGALETGRHEFFVFDGHGHGSIDVTRIHPAARVLTGRRVRYPFGFDDSFDALMIVGHHAKSNTDGGHLSHTFSFAQDDFILNGISLGEIGYYMALAGHSDVPTILVTGDVAACDEAQVLIPEIEVAAVKEGWKSGPANGLTGPENALHNGAAVHLAPLAARSLIRRQASTAVLRMPEIPPYRIAAPYELISILRPETSGGECLISAIRADDLITLGTTPHSHVNAGTDVSSVRSHQPSAGASRG